VKELIEPHLVEVIMGIGLLVASAVCVGLFVGFKFRKQSLEQAAEEILGTKQFSAAAKVEADKTLRSVDFRLAVKGCIEDDARTASSIIRLVVDSQEFRDGADRRINHWAVNNELRIEKQIRASQDELRREIKEDNARILEKIDMLMSVVSEIKISCAHHHID
jgi:hypothetical protein